MNARQKIKLLKHRLSGVERAAASMVRDRASLDAQIIVGSCVRELHHRFRHEDCKRWVEFNIDHPEAGSVHVVLMKPGSKAEELVTEQNKKINALEDHVRDILLMLKEEVRAAQANEDKAAGDI